MAEKKKTVKKHNLVSVKPKEKTEMPLSYQMRGKKGIGNKKGIPT